MPLDRVMDHAPAASLPRYGLRGWGLALPLLAAWLIVVAATGLYRPDFLSHQTLLAIAFTMSIVGVLAIGQALVAISGGFLDLSQPSGLILASLAVDGMVRAASGLLRGVPPLSPSGGGG